MSDPQRSLLIPRLARHNLEVASAADEEVFRVPRPNIGRVFERGAAERGQVGPEAFVNVACEQQFAEFVEVGGRDATARDALPHGAVEERSGFAVAAVESARGRIAGGASRSSHSGHRRRVVAIAAEAAAVGATRLRGDGGLLAAANASWLAGEGARGRRGRVGLTKRPRVAALLAGVRAVSVRANHVSFRAAEASHGSQEPYTVPNHINPSEPYTVRGLRYV